MVSLPVTAMSVLGKAGKKQLEELIFPFPACAEHSQHKMSLRSWIWTALHRPGVILREPLETGLERWAWGEGTWAQREDVGTEKG